MSVIVKSGASQDQLTIDATSKALRALHHSTNRLASIKSTFSAATANTCAPPQGAAMFFVISGSGSKIVTVQKITFSTPIGMVAAGGLSYDSVVVEKWSSQPTGGTWTALTQINSSTASPTVSLCQAYITAPTEGNLVGTLECIRIIAQSTTAVASGPFVYYDADFSPWNEQGGIILRGPNECVSLAFSTGPTGALALMGVSVQWTEE